MSWVCVVSAVIQCKRHLQSLFLCVSHMQFFWLICTARLAMERQSLKYSLNKLVTYILYYCAGPGCLIYYCKLCCFLSRAGCRIYLCLASPEQLQFSLQKAIRLSQRDVPMFLSSISSSFLTFQFDHSDAANLTPCKCHAQVCGLLCVLFMVLFRQKL